MVDIHQCYCVVCVRSPQFWREIFSSVLVFWESLTLAVPSESSQLVLFTEESLSLSDELFPEDFNTIALTSYERKDRVQAWVSTVVTRQLRFLGLEAAWLFSVQKTGLAQLEGGGEAGLLLASLNLLTELHHHHGFGPSHLWALESQLLVQLLEVVSGPSDLRNISQVKTSLLQSIRSLLPLMERKQAMILSSQILDSSLTSPASELREAVSEILQEILRHQTTSDLQSVRSVISARLSDDMELLGSLAAREISASLDKAGEGGEWRSADLLSQSWHSLTGTMMTRLAALPHLKLFIKIVRKLVVTLTLETKVRIEIFSKAMMTSLTERVCEVLGDGEVEEALAVLAVLLEISLLSPAHSDLTDLQHSWAGLLSLPWQVDQEDNLADLVISTMIVAKNVRYGQMASRWGTAEQNTALRLLGLLPGQICPRWRLRVFRLAWDNRLPAVLESLPALPGLGSGGRKLGREVVETITASDQQTDLVSRLAQLSSSYICSEAARPGNIQLVSTGSDLEVRVECEVQHSASTETSNTELDSLLRLVSHEDSEVRLAMVRLLPVAAAHFLLTPEAVRIFMKTVTDPDPQVRFTFAANVHHIMR